MKSAVSKSDARARVAEKSRVYRRRNERQSHKQDNTAFPPDAKDAAAGS